MGQRCFTQTRRAEQQDVIERLFALAGGLDENFQLLTDFDLACVVGEALRAQGAFLCFFLR